MLLVTDIDIMISPEFDVWNQNSVYRIDICNEEWSKGYVYLIERINNKKVSARNLMKEILSKTIKKMNWDISFVKYDDISINGPAIKIWRTSWMYPRLSKGDLTLAIKCKDWNSEVSDWEYRSNRRWPSQRDVNSILSEGYHIVPKSHQNDREGLTWRFSFSHAEVKLSHLVPLSARMCFLGNKVILKDYLNVASVADTGFKNR